MLQNDMGNTRIQDSATGNIMSLSPGFIPVGIKEHGGIMYIASINKDGQGEIGTIPSPIIRNFYKDKQNLSFTDCQLDDKSDAVEITNKIYPADKIIMHLDMKINTDDFTDTLIYHNGNPVNKGDIDPCDLLLKRTCYQINNSSDFTPVQITNPIISYSTGAEQQPTFSKGIYKIKLNSKSVSGSIIEAGPALYEANQDQNYWFYHDSLNGLFPTDLFEATLSKTLKTVPTSTKPGYLQIKLEKESIKDFGMIQRGVSPYNTPYTIKKGEDEYEVYFPGFYYSTDSGVYVASIENTLLNNKTGELCDLTPIQGDKNTSLTQYFSSSSDITTKHVIGFDESTEGNELSVKITEPSDGKYPQFYNEKVFTLSNLTNIIDEGTKVPYTSITILNGVESADKPYSGLFRTTLTKQEYGHWHTLKTVYRDQFGETLGEHICRFNPELNDVFGTNVGIDRGDFSDCLTLGKKCSDITDTLTLTLNTPWTKYINYTTPHPKLYKDDLQNSYFPFQYSNASAYYSMAQTSFSLQESNILQYKYTGKFTGEAFRMQSQYKYLYDALQSFTIYDCLRSNLDKDFGLSFEKESIQFGFGYKEGKDDFIGISQDNPIEFYYCDYLKNNPKLESMTLIDADQGLLLSSITPFHFPEINSEYGEYEICDVDFFGEDKKPHNNSVLWITTSQSADNVRWSMPVNRDITSKVGKFIEQELCQDVKSGDTDEQFEYYVSVKFPKRDIIANFKPLRYDLDDSKGTYNTWRSGLGFTPYKWAVGRIANDEVQNEELNKQNVFRIRAKLKCPEKLTYDINYPNIQPIYKICPYFTLKNQDKYVSKIHLTDNIEYECNLLEEDGVPINFLNGDQFTESNSSVESSYKSIAYNEISKSSNSSIIVESLGAGVYVFNMTAPYAVAPINPSKQFPTLNIKIGDWEKSHDIFRVSGSTQNNKGVGTQVYGKHMWHFWPVVLIVKETSPVSFSIELSEADQYLKYQDVGLYKITTAEMDDAFLQLFKEEFSFILPEYQQKILNHTSSFVASDAVVYRQKYCVFLRQAYSYLEGLYENGTVEQIKFWDLSYPVGAYIPKEPYIVNFIWDKSNDNWKDLNASAMCIYCQPKGVLTKRNQHSFLFFPTSTDESHLTYKMKDTLFPYPDLLSCQPSHYTKLIKKNE